MSDSSLFLNQLVQTLEEASTTCNFAFGSKFLNEAEDTEDVYVYFSGFVSAAMLCKITSICSTGWKALKKDAGSTTFAEGVTHCDQAAGTYGFLRTHGKIKTFLAASAVADTMVYAPMSGTTDGLPVIKSVTSGVGLQQLIGRVPAEGHGGGDGNTDYIYLTIT